MQRTEFEFESMRFSALTGGSGFPILMLHGSGPGVSAWGNFRLVLEGLERSFRILAIDLIGFGESSRKPAKPYFDLDLWLRQARFALNLVGDGPVGIIGHSVSAVLALRLAASNPRVTAVMTTGAMGGKFAANHDLELTWSVPRTRDDLREAMQSLIYNHSLITDELLDNRMKLLGSNGYAGYFGEMFAGNKQQYVDACVLDPSELGGLNCEVTLVHGRDDKPIPAMENSVSIGALIPKADVVLLGKCSHSPAVEHPGKFLDIAKMVFG
ncbi:alpha/beta fold hydrolase [Candidatus Binatus sp.]|uniref:alpha/beta fold hydrolase n=2 Tax=Candidatus Binatus sp. TaxID=2811406 RepID=UPI003CC5F6B1